jgi:hypothetical protein
MKTYSYRNHKIEPKMDFGPHGYLSDGKVIKKGWVVVKDCCNIMPGATWFASVSEAKNAIDVLLKVKGNARHFWEIMQPFKYKRVGQKADIQHGETVCGRFRAVIQNFKVVRLERNYRGAYSS